MFGYVKPNIAELKVKQEKLYKAVYCTLCKRQKKLTGVLSSFSLSYDFVFLALLRSAITNEEFSVVNSRCAYNPLRKKPIIDKCRSIDYTACAATLLTYYKLKDNVNDSKGAAKLKYAIPCLLMKPAKRKAIKKCSLPENEVVNALDALSALELNGDGGLDECAELFGKLLGTVASYGVEDELQGFVLEKCFYNVGRWIYIVDAVDDYPDDLKSGAFNPFGKSNTPDFITIDHTLQAILEQLDNYLLKIKFTNPDVEDIVKNISLLGTEEVFAGVVKSCREKLEKLKGKTSDE